MKHTKNTTPKNTLLKGIGKTAVVAGLGLGLLIPGGSLATFTTTQAMPAATIKTEAFAMTPTTVNLQSAEWKLNNVVITESNLSNLVMKPGDTLNFEAIAKPTVREGTAPRINLVGVKALVTDIGNDPAFITYLTTDGVKASMPTSAMTVLDPRVDNVTSGQTISYGFSISMKPLSSSVYDDLAVGRLKTIDGTGLKYVMTNQNP